MLLFALLALLVPQLALAESLSLPFTVLHTNDLHSHFEGNGPDHYFNPKAEKANPILGHYARLATQIHQIRSTKIATGQPVLLLDSGDFYSGTLFHILGPNHEACDFPELEFFKRMGYDAFTLGNHEFDPTEKGLSFMLEKARQNNLLSGFVVSNSYIRKDPSPLSAVLANVPQFLIKEIETSGKKLKIGILGLVGGDAARVSSVNRSTLSFWGYDDERSRVREGELLQHTQTWVDQLRVRGVDIVIVLFHGGEPEDQRLAWKVKGIDLIVAGHTHEAYFQPKKVGQTWVVQTGSFGRFLGQLDLSFVSDGQGREKKGHLELNNPDTVLLPIRSEITPDLNELKIIEDYKLKIERLLASSGYAYDTPIATITENIVRRAEANNELGIRVTSGILKELNQRIPEAADLYFSSLSLIRENLLTVNDSPTLYQFSDIFRILSIGFEEDGSTPGSPIVSFYMKSGDVIKMMNFLELYRHVSANFTPAYSDTLKYDVRSWGIPFVNRLKGIQLQGKAPDQWPPLVHVATNAFVTRFFAKAAGLSYGWVDVPFRNQLGEVISAPQREAVPSEAVLFADYLRKNQK